MFKKTDEAKEEKHPATKAVMTARVDLTTPTHSMAVAGVTLTPRGELLARVVEHDGHGPTCPTRSMAQLPCGCGWAALVAEVKAVLG